MLFLMYIITSKFIYFLKSTTNIVAGISTQNGACAKIKLFSYPFLVPLRNIIFLAHAFLYIIGLQWIFDCNTKAGIIEFKYKR